MGFDHSCQWKGYSRSTWGTSSLEWLQWSELLFLFLVHLSKTKQKTKNPTSYLSNVHVGKAWNCLLLPVFTTRVWSNNDDGTPNIITPIILLLILLLPLLWLVAIYCFPAVYLVPCRHFTAIRNRLCQIIEQVFVNLWSLFPRSMATFASCGLKIYNHAFWKFPEK